MKTLILLYLRPAKHRQEVVARNRTRLADLGLRLVCADDEIDPRDGESFDDVIVLPPQEEVGRVHEALLGYAREHPVAGVVAQTEAAILPGALLVRSLSLPGMTIEAAHACVNKYESRTTLAGAGVPTPPFRLARTAADVRSFVRSGPGFPVVLKAVASSMSRLVTLVREDAGIGDAVAMVSSGLATFPDVRRLCTFAEAAGIDLGCDPRREFLVEGFAPGAPIETDGIVAGTTPFTFGVTEQVMFPPPCFYIDGYLFPSDRPEAERARIERISDAALRASGIRDSGFSIEMRAGDAGVAVIEVNGRLGQDDGFAELFAPATGCEPIVHTIAMAAGLAPDLVRRPVPPRALAYRCSFVEGTVEAAPDPSQLAALAASGIQSGLSVTPGTRLHAPPHPEAYPHLAWAIASDPRSSRAAYDRAAAGVSSLEFRIA
jgi:biotin carboxylase